MTIGWSLVPSKHIERPLTTDEQDCILHALSAARHEGRDGMYPFKTNPEDTQWIEKARALKEVFAERARQVDAAGGWPHENWQDIIDGGFLKLGVPKEYGGYA
ncbi:MAG: hypothetical protein E5W59_18925, partial [Mesorhizobium sp.]